MNMWKSYNYLPIQRTQKNRTYPIFDSKELRREEEKGEEKNIYIWFNFLLVSLVSQVVREGNLIPLLNPTFQPTSPPFIHLRDSAFLPRTMAYITERNTLFRPDCWQQAKSVWLWDRLIDGYWFYQIESSSGTSFPIWKARKKTNQVSSQVLKVKETM